MRKRLPAFLTFCIFIGINAQQPTDAARKFNDILNKMGVTNTTSPTGCYTEVSPDAHYIHTYDANHECTDSQPISARILNKLNENKQEKNEQEEAEFFCYRLGTKLKMQQESKKISKQTTAEKILHFNKFVVPRVVAFQVIPGIINEALGVDKKLGKPVATVIKLFTTVATTNLTDLWFKNFIYSEKRDAEELDKQTFYNLGFYAEDQYSFLLNQEKYREYKEAFEEGRKAKK